MADTKPKPSNGDKWLIEYWRSEHSIWKRIREKAGKKKADAFRARLRQSLRDENVIDFSEEQVLLSLRR